MPFFHPCSTSGSELIRIVVVLHCCSYALPYTSREHTWIGAKWDRGVGRRAYMWKACIEGRASSTACASPVAMGGHHGCTGRRGANHTRVSCCSCRAGQGQCAHRCRCVPPSPPAVRAPRLFYLRGLSASHLWAQPWSMVLKNVKRPHDDQGMWPQSYMVRSCLFCFFAIVVTELLSTHLAAQTLRSSDLNDYPPEQINCLGILNETVYYDFMSLFHSTT